MLWVLISASVLVIWLAAIVASICIIAALENDSPGWATFTIGATIAVLYGFTDFGLRYPLHITWQQVVSFAILYIVIGVLWSLGKWWLELISRRTDWIQAEREYRHTYNLNKDAVIDRTNPQFIAFLRQNPDYSKFVIYNDGRIIKVKDAADYVVKVRPLPNRARNIARMTYWPWSLFWSIFDDLIRNIFRTIYNFIAGAYHAMVESVFRNIPD